VRRIAYVDVVGGVAGDMLLAALLDAGAPLPAVIEAVEAVLPGRFAMSLDSVLRAGLRASLVRITPAAQEFRNGTAHHSPRELLAIIQAAHLPDRVRRVAAEVVNRLSEAEARVHGVDVGHLRLDELGSDDTVLDVVGIATALDRLEVDHLFVSSVPIAVGGTLAGSHAGWPLPSPAALELLRGFAVRGVEDGELVTPTAAAVFATLGSCAPQPPPMTIAAIGYGAGTKDWERRPNVVRIMVGAPAPESAARRISLLETNLDDLSPELVADAAEALRAAGALDVWTVPAQMKKNRAGVVLAALCEPESEATIEKVLFETTPTFGIRVRTIRRVELTRKFVSVELPAGSVRVKVGIHGDRVMSATPEHDDVAELARRTNRSVRAVYDEAVVASRKLLAEGAERLIIPADF
jgi:pyridinium-3,5-bisthiocarboxylic acid mononucleotide nickel chelatase